MAQEIVQTIGVNLGNSTQTIGELRENFDELSNSANVSSGYLKQVADQAKATGDAVAQGMLSATEATKAQSAANAELAQSMQNVNQAGGSGFLDTMAKQKIAFLDIGRVVTDQGFSLRSLASNFGLLGPEITIAVAVLAGLGEVLLKNVDLTTQAEKEQQNYNNVLIEASKNAGDAVVSIEKMNAQFSDSTSVSDRKTALDDYNKTFGDTIGYAKSFDEAEQRLKDHTADYITAMKFRAEADAAYGLQKAALADAAKAQVEGETSIFAKIGAGVQQFFGNYEGEAETLLNSNQKIVKSNNDQADSYAKIAASAEDSFNKIKQASGGGQNKPTKTDDSAERAREKALADAQNFHDNLLKINDDAQAKEELNLTQHYNKVKDELENSNQDTTQLTIDYNNGIIDIQNKYLEKSLDDSDKAFETAVEHKAQRDAKQHDKDIIQAQKDAQDLQDAIDGATTQAHINALATDKAGLTNDKLTYDAKKALLDQYSKDNQTAYNTQSISYKQFVDNKASIAKSEEQIDKERLANQVAVGEGVGSLLTNLSQAIGQQTAVGKDIAVAGAIVSTIAGAIGAFTKTSGAFPAPYGEILGALAGASVLAAGYAQISELEKVQIPGQGSSSSSASSALGGATSSFAAPTLPTATNNTNLSAQSLQQINQANTKPVRAYVVESDITSSQNTVQSYRNASQIGGH